MLDDPFATERIWTEVPVLEAGLPDGATLRRAVGPRLILNNFSLSDTRSASALHRCHR